MNQILLVDDEFLAMQYIAQFECIKRLGFEVVGKALNGKQGFEAFCTLKPELILSDIKMPVEDGISMATRIKELAPAQPPFIILLTSYSEFEYVKSAFDVGIDGYILKHELTNEKLAETLEKIREKIQLRNESQMLLRSQALKDILLLDACHTQELYASAYQGKSYLPIIVHKNLVLHIGTGELQNPIGDGIYEYIVKKLASLSSTFGDVLFADLDNLSYILLVEVETNSSLFLMQQYLQQIHQELKEAVQQQEGFGTLVYALQAFPVEQLHTFYNNYRQNLKNLFFYQHLGTVNIDSLCFPPAAARKEDTLLARRSIVQLFEQNRPQEGFACLDNFLEQQKRKNDDIEVFCSTVRDIFQAICSYRRQLVRDAALPGLQESIPSLTASHIPQMQLIFRRMQQLIAAERECNRYSPKVNYAMRYIQQHYQNDVSVEQIADEQNISMVYLSRIFKKETGTNLVEYLTSYRIKKSKELLDHTNLKIFEIADLVGYHSSQYFSSIFKKFGGLSPYEYRERKR